MFETVLSYEDWKDFFARVLLDSGRFCLAQDSAKGHTHIEIYSTLKGDPGTTIEIGYFSSMTLISVSIFNPQTPGMNRQQEQEYLYKYEFDPEKQYGPPGLEFNEINIRGIASYLSQGFNGTETVYYRGQKPVKSRVATSYYPESPRIETVYYFDDESVFRRLLNRLMGKDGGYDAIKTIDLKSIFPGIGHVDLGT